MLFQRMLNIVHVELIPHVFKTTHGLVLIIFLNYLDIFFFKTIKREEI